MDKVYIVETKKGYYEDTVDLVIGVYSDMWTAEKAREQFFIDLNELKNKYTKEQVEEYEKNIADESKEAEEYWDWKYEHRYHEYSEQVNIKEIRVNETLLKLKP